MMKMKMKMMMVVVVVVVAGQAAGAAALASCAVSHSWVFQCSAATTCKEEQDTKEVKRGSRQKDEKTGRRR